MCHADEANAEIKREAEAFRMRNQKQNAELRGDLHKLEAGHALLRADLKRAYDRELKQYEGEMAAMKRQHALAMVEMAEKHTLQLADALRQRKPLR